jgi:hypothetical protein
LNLDNNKKYVLFSFGRHKNFDFFNNDTLNKIPKDWIIIFIKNEFKNNYKNVYFINDKVLKEKNLKFEDIIKAIDVIISKPSKKYLI